MKKNNIKKEEEDETSHIKEYKKNILESYWDKWLIFKQQNSKDFQTELKKQLPPYLDSNVNKINEFSMRENAFFPPCPQEFLEHLLNGIILRNELGLFRSKFYFYKELQQLLEEFLKLFYFRMDTITDIFQTNTKLSISKEKYPRIVVKCSNCSFYDFIIVIVIFVKMNFIVMNHEEKFIMKNIKKIVLMFFQNSLKF